MKWNRNRLAEAAATIGCVAALGALIVHSYQQEWRLPSEILLIAGGLLFLAGIVLGLGAISQFFSRRSSQLGTNTTILSLAVLAILGLLNFVSYRHHKRFDLTTEKLYTLSDQTRKVLRGLTQDVTIVRFANRPDTALDDLMTEYKNLSPHFKFESVDPTQKPEIAKEYGAQHMGDIIVAAGTRKETLQPSYETGQASYSEQDVTSTIVKVTQNSVKAVCFVTGHDEKALSDSGAQGYSAVGDGLKKEGYNTKSINLVTENGVPPSCDILVIAGPTKGFFPQEAALVSKYLDAGGKGMIEEDPETDPKLDDIFQAWNINVGKNVVVDASGVGRLFGTGPGTPLVVDYGDSPITKNLQGGMTFFALARTVSIADKVKSDPQAVELLKTSPRSFTIPKLVNGEVHFDPKTAGPLSLGVGASRQSGDKSSRLVAIGNSAFAENQWLDSQHNGDLFFNAIDWLAQDENLISIRPKPPTARHIILTESQMAGLRWFELIFLPAFVLLVGVSIWWKRR